MHAFEFNWIKNIPFYPEFSTFLLKEKRKIKKPFFFDAGFKLSNRPESLLEKRNKRKNCWVLPLSIGYFLRIFRLFRYLYVCVYIYISLSLRAGTRVYSTYRRRSVIIVINGISNVCARY